MGNRGGFQFGTFTFDTRAGELFQDGRRVALERQPATVLHRLLKSAGQTVTRQELIEAVWGADTSVCFDDGLNYCIRQLRIALDDDSRAPRFIVTAPRRGYRFIAQVATTDAAAGQALRWRAVLWPAVAALILLGTLLLESRPNNHHQLAVSAARTVHNALF
jgi:DNA-binding winged helix-turn-helix (wHTH) protein